MKEINIVIEDAAGLYTGVSIENVECRFEKEKDQLRIYGQLIDVRGNYSCFEEPEVSVDFYSKGKVIFTTTSEHAGRFIKSKKVTFRVELTRVSEKFAWDELKEVKMYVVFV